MWSRVENSGRTFSGEASVMRVCEIVCESEWLRKCEGESEGGGV